MAAEETEQYTKETYRQAYGELMSALRENGFPPEFGKLLAKNLKAEKSLRRMSSYLRLARPKSMELIADEMLAIMEDRRHWIEKKQAEEAGSRYNAWLNSSERAASEDGSGKMIQ